MRSLHKSSYFFDYLLSNLLKNFELVVYSSLCFFLPLFIGHPQIIVGVGVNACLILAALNLKGNRVWPVILLPSLGVLSRGIIFGPLTIFLIYFIPFIWISNAFFVYSFKIFMLKRKLNYFLTLFLGIAFKCSFLFVSALILYKLNLVPEVFLSAMGLMQIITAAIGGVVAFSVYKFKKKIFA
jgi:hypothetical protein